MDFLDKLTGVREGRERTRKTKQGKLKSERNGKGKEKKGREEWEREGTKKRKGDRISNGNRPAVIFPS